METIKKPPEREQTDEGLRKERKHSDKVLKTGEQLTTPAIDLELSREKADSAQAAAREDIDHELSAAPKAASTGAVIAHERAVADEMLHDERAASDEARRHDRRLQLQELAALLRVDREKTDQFLLTERIRADDALASRDDFLGIVSHDLRNLLFAISLRAANLARGSKVGPAAEGQAITRVAARMSKILDDLIDVVSIDAGKLAVQTVRANLVPLITEATEAFASVAAEKGVTLRNDSVERELLADFDRERMLQVLANLLGNSIKFTPKGGEVILQAWRGPTGIHLSVRDSGVGMPAEKLERVFDRFWQIGKNDKRGLGLGLYIAKTIVEAHGGTILAESQPGAGSTFTVTLPDPLQA